MIGFITFLGVPGSKRLDKIVESMMIKAIKNGKVLKF